MMGKGTRDEIWPKVDTEVIADRNVGRAGFFTSKEEIDATDCLLGTLRPPTEWVGVVHHQQCTGNNKQKILKKTH